MIHDPPTAPEGDRRELAAILAVDWRVRDDPEDAYCDAWEGTVDAYTELRSLDVTAVGTDGLRDCGRGPRLVAPGTGGGDRGPGGRRRRAVPRHRWSSSIETVLSPELPVDRRDEVAAAVDDLRSAWDDVAAAVQVECPDVDVSSS